MEIRAARPADLEAIVEVHVESSRAAYAALPAAVVEDVAPEVRIARWRGVLADPASRLWVAADEPSVLGFCHLRLPQATEPPPRHGEIASLYVAPSHWGQGLGRGLVARARDAAVAAGCDVLALCVYAANHRARAAYAALGFVTDATTTIHERTGLPVMSYTMSLVRGV